MKRPRPSSARYIASGAQSWRELLVEVKRHGLIIAPELAIGDGALGFWKALEEIYPGTRHQRCWVHKTANVLNKGPKSVQAAMKDDLRKVHGAPTRAGPKRPSSSSTRSTERSTPGRSPA